MEPFIGEIRMFTGNYAPRGWAFCDGQLLSIHGNEVLYSLLGTRYGGDGNTTFALPDLRGRVPMHESSTYPSGTAGGDEKVALTQDQLPAHTHAANTATAVSGQPTPANQYWASGGGSVYSADRSALVKMSAAAVAPVGVGQSHANMMPFLTISYIICLSGIYPTRD